MLPGSLGQALYFAGLVSGLVPMVAVTCVPLRARALLRCGPHPELHSGHGSSTQWIAASSALAPAPSMPASVPYRSFWRLPSSAA